MCQYYDHHTYSRMRFTIKSELKLVAAFVILYSTILLFSSSAELLLLFLTWNKHLTSIHPERIVRQETTPCEAWWCLPLVLGQTWRYGFSSVHQTMRTTCGPGADWSSALKLCCMYFLPTVCCLMNYSKTKKGKTFTLLAILLAFISTLQVLSTTFVFKHNCLQ